MKYAITFVAKKGNALKEFKGVLFHPAVKVLARLKRRKIFVVEAEGELEMDDDWKVEAEVPKAVSKPRARHHFKK